MKIVVTGAGGLVGGALATRLASEHELLALKRGELDVTDGAAVGRRLRAERPDLIINCAVVGVDTCERDPALAQAVNERAVAQLAATAAGLGAEFLHFSTNYVFDGRRDDGAAYTTADAPAPVNVYGRTKLAGERVARTAAPRSFIVRTSWVFGPGKENFFSAAHRRLRAGTPVHASADATASTTYVFDLVARVWEIVRRGRYATYHVVNGGGCSRYEFALAAARCVGLTQAEATRLIMLGEETDAAGRAPRPRHTPLRCLVSEGLGLPPLRDWRAALAEYVRLDMARVPG